MRTTVDPLAAVAELGRIVAVWAHPDDESYLTAGVMAIAAQLGQPVTCVTATTGDFADDECARRMVGLRRQRELDTALGLLGVDDRVQLDLGDGRCQHADAALATSTIASVIRSRRPDTVITFGPDGLTGHADHRAVSNWTTAAVAAAAAPTQLLYATMTPELHAADADVNERFSVYEPGFPVLHDDRTLALRLVLEGEWLDRKLAALHAHASQTHDLVAAIGLDRYRHYIATELFIAAEDW